MIQELKTYICSNSPTDEDINQALAIVKDQSFIIKFKWFVRYSGWYEATVKNEMTFEQVKEQIPKIYGI